MTTKKTALDFGKVKAQVDAGLINVQHHPVLDLRIYNYAPKAQYTRTWTPETLACRGLITDGLDRIVANPFPKFFNYGEMSRSDITFSKPFRAFEKLDGSLGILYPTPGGWAIATRGSFTSDQAIRATEMLRTQYPEFEPFEHATYLFEILYPENRIVLDYGDRSELVLLAIRSTETGAEIKTEVASEYGWYGPVVKEFEIPAWYTEAGQQRPQFGKMDWFGQLGVPEDGTQEGLVFLFENGTRVKMKVDEYVRLHKLLTGTSAKTIWEYLSRGTTLTLLLEDVPDEFYDWVRETAKQIQAQYERINNHAREDYIEVLHKMNVDTKFYDPANRAQRAEFAAYAKETQYPGLLFQWLDGNLDKLEEAIWKMVKPRWGKAFSADIDDS